MATEAGRLADGGDAPLDQLGDHPAEHLGGGSSVRERPVVGVRARVVEGGEVPQVVPGELGVEPSGQCERVEHGTREGCSPDTLGLVVEEAEVETVTVGDQYRAAGELGEGADDVAHIWGLEHHRGGDARQVLDDARHGAVRPNESRELAGHSTVLYADSADIDDGPGARTGPRGLDIDGDEGAGADWIRFEHVVSDALMSRAF